MTTLFDLAVSPVVDTEVFASIELDQCPDEGDIIDMPGPLVGEWLVVDIIYHSAVSPRTVVVVEVED